MTRGYKELVILLMIFRDLSKKRSGVHGCLVQNHQKTLTLVYHAGKALQEVKHPINLLTSEILT